jgi:hypothetical protein
MKVKYGLLLELNANGLIVRSFHDPTGTVFPSVSQATEYNNMLYLGSSDTKFVGLLNLTALAAGI